MENNFSDFGPKGNVKIGGSGSKMQKSESYLGELTYENALPQTNIAFIDDIVDELEGIKSAIFEGTIYPDRNPGEQVLLVKKFNTISDILTKRFKWNIRFSVNIDKVLSTELSPPPEFNILGGDYKQYLENLDNYLNNKDIGKFDAKTMVDSKKYFFNYLQQRRTSLAALKKQLETRGVLIDDANAQIHNMPSSYMGVINFNPFYWFSKDRDTDTRELVGAIIHEVGHQYTSIRESYRKVLNSHTLVDTMHQVVTLETTAPIDGLKLAYAKMGGTKNTDNMNYLEVVVGIKNRFSGKNLDDDDSRRFHSTEGETQADQFAARFGLGAELASLLKKDPSEGRQMLSMETVEMALIEYKFFLGILYCIGAPYVVIMFAIYFSFDILELSNINKESRTYEGYLRRMIKIKQDYVRQIRILKKSGASEERLEKVRAIHASIENIEKSYKGKTPYITDILEKMSLGKNDHERLNLIYTEEDLINNKLHML